MALLDTYGLQQLDQWCLRKLLLRFFFLPVGHKKRGCAFCLFPELLHVFVVLSLRRDNPPPPFYTFNVSASLQVTASTGLTATGLQSFLFS